MKTIFSWITVFGIIVGINSNHLLANPQIGQDTTEILFIGSSYFNYNNLAGLVKNIADSANREVYTEMYGQNGLYLSDHASSPGTEAKINEREWDFVILQGVGVLVAYPDNFTSHPVYSALKTLRDKIHANCQSTRMVYCLPWAFEDGMIWYQNWPDTYEDMQILIYNNTLQYSNEIGFEIAPVGWAWYGVLDELDYPLHYLHVSDWNHPSIKGSYLMASVIYASVFQESVAGNSFTAGIPDDEAYFFQTVASDTVLNNLELWNIYPLSSSAANKGSFLNFQLKQNSPNPFRSQTQIEYELFEEVDVRVDILDLSGLVVSVVVDERLIPGNYKLIFDACGLSSGIYICHLQTGRSFQSQKLILNK